MSTPVLRLDTSYLDASGSLTSPSGTTGTRARSLSQSVLPSFRLPTSPNIEKSFADLQRSVGSHGISKAQNESRKLLAHLLIQLQNRTLPPSSMEAANPSKGQVDKGLGAVMQSVKGAVKHKRGKSEGRKYSHISQDDSDSELEEETAFSTDATIDLMNQLKDVLFISATNKWDILNDRAHSRSFSTSALSDSERTPQLLSRCIATLSSVIAEDCRFRTSFPRPLRPPNALQAVTLDVAQFLINAHRHDPHIVSQIVFATLPAFYTFDATMHTRLLAFFDDGVLGSVLDDIRRIQGTQRKEKDSLAEDVSYDSARPSKPPMVSIQVDEVEDMSPSSASDSNWRRWSKTGSSMTSGTRSSRAPGQDVGMYLLTSFIPPLFSAIFDNVDLASERLQTMHRFHRLFGRILEAKPDAYLDILAVIAYHTPKARYSAVQVLMSYWPRAVGHLVISKAFPDLSYAASLARATQGPSYSRRSHHHAYAHQFLPWRFSPSSMPVLFGSVSHDDCRACSKPIVGFGLLCPFCLCAVHFDCYDYPDGSSFSDYSVASGEERQRIAMYRFCHVLLHRRQSLPESIIKEQHTFRLVNLFSLTLCLICRRPLWGCFMQALRCSSCKQFVHTSCLAASSGILPCRQVSIDDTYVTIDWSSMRNSFLSYYQDCILTDAEVVQRTYEEISTYFAMLWLQLQILQHGIALGSIVVTKNRQASSDSFQDQFEEFELHELVHLYEDYLSSARLPISDALADHFEDNKLRASDVAILFDWKVLSFIASAVKMPATVADSTSPSSFGLLHVGQAEPLGTLTPDDSSSSFEVLPLAHLRDQLGDQFHIFAEPAARHMIAYLSHIGFFQRLDLRPVSSDDLSDPDRTLCCFPLPVGVEMSTEVETLVSAIEGCLSDLDISVNETGFLLLTRRFWPDGILTNYAMRRLCAAVILWIMSEDHNLAITLRDYVAKGRSLPGVRSRSDIQSWPPQTQARPALMSAANNGGDYIAGRRSLLERYAARWMLALHDLDIGEYAAMIFEILSAQSEEGDTVDEYFFGKETDHKRMRKQLFTADRLMRSIIKLNQASVLFTAFDDVFRRWLERAQDLSLDQEPVHSLSRLFNREVETSGRLSSLIDSRLTMGDASNLATTSALRVLTDTATGSREGFEHTIHWLCLFVRSGVDIAIQTFMQFASLARRFDATLDECSQLIKAVMWSAWLRSVGRQDLQAVVAALHTHLVAHITACLRARIDLEKITCFIRHSLSICLLVYGCERSYVTNLGMLQDEDVRGLLSRRKLHSRSSTMTDPVIINADLMGTLKSYVESEVDEISCLVAKFLNAFVNEAPFVESYEVDNFILRNGATLCTCMWQFYGIQLPDISTIRPALLLRVLVVDSHPFQTLLDELVLDQSDWNLRLQAALRLFRIILDVTSPVFVVEGRQWRTSVIIVFDHFFSRLWTDEREEVRLAVDTWSQTLLEAHFNAIALCWNEALAKAPINERVKLVSFLNQLHSHFPKWPVLSWNSITETLLEDGDDDDDPAAAHLAMYGLSSRKSTNYVPSVDPDLDILKVSLLSLALHMIADGVSIDPIPLVKIKDHVVKVLGFQHTSMIPTANGRSFHIQFSGLKMIPESADACLNDLMLILDSSQPYDISPSLMGGPYAEDETPCSLLIGSVFVDVLLELLIHAEDIMTLPFVTLKNMLKSLIIILYKHDFESRALKHLQGGLRRAVHRTLELLLTELSYELRQLALSACHIFIKRWPTVIGNFVIEAIESAVGLMVALDYERNVDDTLIEQTTAFLSTTLTMFASGGIFNALCKRSLAPSFFSVVRVVTAPHPKTTRTSSAHEGLRDSLLRDTLARSLENDPDAFQLVLENLRTYVEVVHHTDFSSDVMQSVGLWLTAVIKRTADWPPDVFDPSPLFLIACTLIDHNRAQSRDLLGYLETLLRAALIRCNVSTACLVRSAQVTSLLYRKAGVAKTAGAGPVPTNPIVLVLVEALTDAIRLKTRMTTSTLASLYEAITATVVADLFSGNSPSIPEGLIYALAADSLIFLYGDNATGYSSQATFDTMQAAATLVLDVALFQPTVMGGLKHIPCALRVWNMLALAALRNIHKQSAVLLFEYFSIFALAYSHALGVFQQPQQLLSNDSQDSAHIEISNAYVAIKLWLLLVRKTASSHRESRERLGDLDDADVLQDGEILATKMVWNELWPPFGRVMSVLEADVLAGHVSPLALTMWSSVADLLLFLRQSRTVALDISSQISIIDRLRGVMQGESKLARVMRSLTEPPPDVPFDDFVNQVATDIRAEEKLHAARRYDAAPEKGRRIVS